MSAFFRRECEVQVNDVSLVGSRVVFKVEKTIRREPNSISLKIYNLAESTRNRLEFVARKRARLTPRTPGTIQPRKLVYLDIKAGYEGALHTIFRGDVRRLKSVVETPDVITMIISGDGEARTYTARVNRAFRAGTAPQAIFEHLIEALGVEPGQSLSQVRGAQLGNLVRYTTGVVLSGSASVAMDDICAAAGFEWSVQDGVMQLVRLREAPSQAATLLTPRTGLIGTPTREGLRVIKGKCLIQPGVTPGKYIRVETALVNASVRVYKTTITGDTHGGDWSIDFEGAPPLPQYAQRVIPP